MYLLYRGGGKAGTAAWFSTAAGRGGGAEKDGYVNRAFVSSMLLTIVVSGCAIGAAPRPPIREAVSAEQDRILTLLAPLLAAADLGPSPQCPIELGIVLTDTIGAVVDESPSCTNGLALSVSDGALRALADLELQAMLAHEVGHLAACGDHGSPCPRMRERTASREVEEIAADRRAAVLLSRVGGRPACLALVLLFERLAQDPGTHANWLSDHPSPGRRARAARAACETPR